MSKRENELDKQKNQNRLSAAKDNPETDIYENPIENAAEMVNGDTANEDRPNFVWFGSYESRLP
jgi:hypothetical protein